MASVYLARFNRWLERIFNVKGGPTIFDVDPNVHLSMDYPAGNEDRFLQGFNRFTQLANIAANAANSGGARLRNPAGSNVIVVVEKLLLNKGSATASTFSVQQGLATTDLTTGSTGFRQDTRGNPNSSAILSIQNTTPANLATNIAFVTQGAGQNSPDLIMSPNQELVLLPGDALQVIDQTVNEQVLVHFMWRERALEQSEFN